MSKQTISSHDARAQLPLTPSIGDRIDTRTRHNPRHNPQPESDLHLTTTPDNPVALREQHTQPEPAQHAESDRRSHLSVRINPRNQDHHLWNNNGTWWVHFTVHLTDYTKQRVRLSLETNNVEQARVKRDEILARNGLHRHPRAALAA